MLCSPVSANESLVRAALWPHPAGLPLGDVVENQGYLAYTGQWVGTSHTDQYGLNLRFPDGTPGVSHQHCCIRIDQGGPILIDLNSRFGTALADGKKLPPNYPERLQPGSRFYVGSPENLCQIVYL